MSPLMRTLFEYVSVYCLDPQRIDPEYYSFSDCADRQEEQLRSMLSEEGQQLLSGMLDELLLCRTIELEAMFCSALALGRELAGLIHR